MTKGPCATNYSGKREAEKSSPTSAGHLLIITACGSGHAWRAEGSSLHPHFQMVMGAGSTQASPQPMQAKHGREGWFTAPILT